MQRRAEMARARWAQTQFGGSPVTTQQWCARLTRRLRPPRA